MIALLDLILISCCVHDDILFKSPPGILSTALVMLGPVIQENIT